VDSLSRRDFLTACTKENLKHVFRAFHEMKEGEKETSRRSCDEAAKMFFKKRLHKMK
jgi:hypothetical protein